MREQIEEKLAGLKSDHARMVENMTKIEQQRQLTQVALLQIEGAIQVLTNLLAEKPLEYKGEGNGEEEGDEPGRGGA